MTDQTDLPAPPSKRIAVAQSPQSLTVTYRWFSGSSVGMLLAALVWNGLVVFLAVLMQSKPGTDTTDWTYVGLAGLVGLWLLYYAVCLLANRTTIEATRQEVRIRIQPLPWPGNKRIDTDRMGPLYVRMKTSRRRHRAGHGPHYRYRQATFQLRVVRTDGKHRPLVSGLSRPEDAVYLEHTLEAFLGLPDEPVAGAFDYSLGDTPT